MYGYALYTLGWVPWCLCRRVSLFLLVLRPEAIASSSNGIDDCELSLRMGRKWSAGKLVLILDAVHWNPEAPQRTGVRLPPSL